MKNKERRKRFLIIRTLQFHYLIYVVASLAIVSIIGMSGTYFGIWASVVDAFSEESLRESMMTAAQLNDYEQARRPLPKRWPSLRVYRETALLSERQKEIIQEIMNETQKRMIGLGGVLLFFIGWGSIFLTHKIAGPLFKLRQVFQELENGNLKARIEFRKFDEGHDLAKRFNTMSASLDAKIGKMKRLAQEIPTEKVVPELKKELGHFKTTAD